MTAQNYIGNVWAGACDALLNGVLRGEWGVHAQVVSDWYGGYGYMNADLSLANGGDRMLTTTDMAALIDTKSASALLRMRQASKNILFSMANLALYGGVSLGVATWVKWVTIFDILIGSIVAVSKPALCG